MAAFAASVFYHLTIYAGIFVAGLWYLRRSGFSLRAIRAESKAAQPPSD